MPSNVTQVPGATAIEYYLGNYAYTDIASSMGNLQFKLDTAGSNRIFYKDASGNLYKIMVDSSGASNHAADRLLYTNSDGENTVSANLTFDGTDVLLGSNGKIQFRDSAIYIQSSADGYLDLNADLGINLNDKVYFGDSIYIDGVNRIQFRDPNIHIKSDFDGYLDITADVGLDLNANTTINGNLYMDTYTIYFRGTNNYVTSLGSTSLDLYASDLIMLNQDTQVYINKKLQFRDNDIYLVSETNGNLDFYADGYFNFHSHIQVESSNRIYFRDLNQYIASGGTGYLDLTAATLINLNQNTLLSTDKSVYFRSTSNGINSSSTGILDITATTKINLNQDTQMYLNKRLYFRDSNNYIVSASSGYLDLYAQSQIDMNASVMIEDGYVLRFRDTQIYIGSDADGYLDLYADTRIDLNQTTYINGSLGIGETSPDELLHIKHASTPTIKLEQTGQSCEATIGIHGIDPCVFYIGTDTNHSIYFYVNSTHVGTFDNGGFTIGTQTGSEELDVDGNARFRSIGSGSSSGALHYESDGTLTTSTSDVRLKDVLGKVTNSLDDICKLNPVKFKWKPKKNKRTGEIKTDDTTYLGLIAQEVEEIFPEAVFTNENDGYKGIHDRALISIIINAIKELNNNLKGVMNER